MTSAICVPWRPTPAREPLWHQVQDHIGPLGLPVYTADSDGPVFSRGQALNTAMKQASSDGHTVALLLDADVIVDLPSAQRAMALTAADGIHRLAYTEYFLCGPDGPSSQPMIGAVSGAVVVHLPTVAPFDERFVGWGYEDVDFAIRNGPLRRVAGQAYGLWHPPEQVNKGENLRHFRSVHGPNA